MADTKYNPAQQQQSTPSKEARLVEIQKKIDELCAEREKLKSS